MSVDRTMRPSAQYLVSLGFAACVSLSCQKEIVRERVVETDYALQFDGATTAVEIPMIREQQPTQLTVETMVKFDDLGGESIPIISHSGLDQWNRAEGFGLKYEAKNVYWTLASSSRAAESFFARVDLLPGTWYQISCTFDGRIGRIYLDGKLLVESSRKPFIAYGDRGMTLGKGYHSEFGGELSFRGQMDEVRIWDHARTQQQIMAGLFRTLTGNETGLVGYWNFNGRAEFLDPAEDRSPYRNHGQVSGKLRLIRSTGLTEQ